MRRAIQFPHGLAMLFSLFFIALAIAPLYRDIWVAEAIPVVTVFLGLTATYSRFAFSNGAYVMMAFWLFWHTIGGHYTFAHVPFGWITDSFGFERNHFDRFGHFFVGFYAYAAVELLLRKKWSGYVLANVFGLFFVMSIAAGYEIVEWLFAVSAGEGDIRIEFLGSQGDVWDAQKDMLADTLGAIFALLIYRVARPDLKQRIE